MTSHVVEKTGYPQDLLEYIYFRYGPKNSITWNEFLQILGYIHLYPTRRQSYTVLGVSKTTLHENILPKLTALANSMQEIDWEGRLNPYNHTLEFPYLFTGIVDTFPIEVQKPKNSDLRKALFTNKYGTTVYKVQIGVSFLGELLFCTGPHLPRYDGHIWTDTMAYHPLESWEWWIGDGHYISCDQILTPWRKDRQLTEEETLANTIISFYRARVEHINAYFLRHAMFKGVYRGGVNLLNDALSITAHMSAAYLRANLRYSPVGPWSHLPK